jgi:hypothetical protein
VMEAARKKARIDIDREQSQRHNPNSVLADEQREGSQGQNGFRPGGPNRFNPDYLSEATSL